MTEHSDGQLTPRLPNAAGESPTPVAVHDPVMFRQLSLIGPVPPCMISIDDLKRLFADLEQKVREAFEKYAASIQRPANISVDEFQRLRNEASEHAHVTVLVLGAEGEQLAATTIDMFDRLHLPEKSTR